MKLNFSYTYLFLFAVPFLLGYLGLFFILTKDKSEPGVSDHLYSAALGIFLGVVGVMVYHYMFVKRRELLRGSFYSS